MADAVATRDNAMIGQWLRKLLPDTKPSDAASESDAHKSLIQDTYSTIDSLAEKRRRREEEITKIPTASIADALLNARDRVILP